MNRSTSARCSVNSYPILIRVIRAIRGSPPVPEHYAFPGQCDLPNARAPTTLFRIEGDPVHAPNARRFSPHSKADDSLSCTHLRTALPMFSREGREGRELRNPSALRVFV